MEKLSPEVLYKLEDYDMKCRIGVRIISEFLKKSYGNTCVLDMAILKSKIKMKGIIQDACDKILAACLKTYTGDAVKYFIEKAIMEAEHHATPVEINYEKVVKDLEDYFEIYDAEMKIEGKDCRLSEGIIKKELTSEDWKKVSKEKPKVKKESKVIITKKEVRFT